MTPRDEQVRPLRIELKELHALVRQLTQRRVVKVIRDDRSVTEHDAPSLLDELRGEIGVGGDRNGGGAGVPGSRMPLSPGVADTLAAIEQRVMQLQAMVVRAEGPTVEGRLHEIDSVVGAWADAYSVAWIAGEIRQLVSWIDGTITPTRRITIRSACPACSAVRVEQTDDLGETVRAPALSADDRNGASCAGCGKRWAAEELARLIASDDAPVDEAEVDNVG